MATSSSHQSNKSTRKKSNFLKHYCELPIAKEKVYSPYTSILSRWCDGLTKYRTVYKSSVSAACFRSNHAIEQEKKRHINNPRNQWTIHPFSSIALLEKAVMLFVWFLTFLLAPFIGAFYTKDLLDLKNSLTVKETVLIISRFIAGCDTVLRFFLGYQVTKTREIVLDRKIIMKHYLKTYFLTDFIPLVCLLLDTVLEDRIYKLLTFQFVYVALLRLGSFLTNLAFFMRFYRFHHATRTSVIFLISAIFLVHWWTCILKFIAVLFVELHLSQAKNSLMNMIHHDLLAANLKLEARDGYDLLGEYHEYFSYYGIVACHFFGTGSTRFKTSSSLEWFTLSLIMINGLLFYIYGLAKITEFYSTLNASESSFETLIMQVEGFMVINQYPKKLRRRILKYYSYKYDNRFFSEHKIMNELTEHLRMEVVLYGSQHLVETLHTLKGLSRQHVGVLLRLLKPEIYLTNDIVMQSDDENKNCYIILYGTCSIELLKNTEILHVEDGDSFGNAWTYAAGMNNTSFVYQVVALEPCEIYTLEIEDAKMCMRQHPELAHKMKVVAVARDRQFEETYTYVLERNRRLEAISILQELENKRILYHERHRMPPPTIDYYTPSSH